MDVGAVEGESGGHEFILASSEEGIPGLAPISGIDGKTADAVRQRFAGSDFQADQAHEFDSVAVGDYAVAEFVVEGHLAVGDLVLQVDVVEGVGGGAGQVGEGEVVRADEADGSGFEEGADYAFGADEAVFGVGALQELVEEEEEWGLLLGEVAEVAEPGDLGVEAGAALLQGVVDEDAGSDLEGGELEALGADRSAGHGEDGVDADGAHEGALAGHVGAADEQGSGVAGDADVVADALCGGDERVAEGFGVRRKGGPVTNSGKGSAGMLEAGRRRGKGGLLPRRWLRARERQLCRGRCAMLRLRRRPGWST